jgi:hypothetical protein
MATSDFNKSFLKLPLAVKKVNFFKADKCLTEILEISESQDSVPSNLVKEFFGYLLDEEKTKEIIYSQKRVNAWKISKKAFKRFKKSPRCNFGCLGMLIILFI